MRTGVVAHHCQVAWIELTFGVRCRDEGTGLGLNPGRNPRSFLVDWTTEDMSNSTVFRIRHLFHSCNGARIQYLPIYQTDKMQRQKWFDNDDRGKMWQCSCLKNNLSSPAVSSFPQGANLTPALCLLKRWIINWIPQPGPYVNEITITELSIFVWLRWKRNSKWRLSCMVLSLIGSPSWFDDWIYFLPNEGPSALYKRNQMVIIAY